MSNKDIVIKNIYKSFQNKTVLNNFSAKIYNGKTNCLYGPSGSGKTTLTRILLGLESIEEGTVQNCNGLRKSAVFQEDRLCENLSAITNVKMVIEQKDKTEIATKILTELGLGQNLNQRVSELSGGMKRRVAIARAIATDYNLIVLDEPFKGLDKKNKLNTINVVKKYTSNHTVIVVTHDTKEAELMGTDNYINFD